MSILVVLASLCLFEPVATAGYATQTDWSGGDGVPGPVPAWGNEFDTATDIDWFSQPGQLELYISLITPVFGSVMDSGPFQPLNVHTPDIDGDGEADVLSYGFDRVVWWRNEGSGAAWTMITLPFYFQTTWDVSPGDIDGNGTCDVVRGNTGMGKGIRWYENFDGSGTSWVAHVITQSYEAYRICASDIDGDGDLDVAFIEVNPDSVYWYENANGYGTDWQLHTCPPSGTGGYQRRLKTVDLDGDGDIDFVVATESGIVWYENTDGTGTSMLLHLIDSLNYNGEMASFDIDGDGDMDITVSSTNGNNTGWFENLNGMATEWTFHLVSTAGKYFAWPFDADADGDGDLLTDRSQGLSLWLNDDGSGTSWTKVDMTNSSVMLPFYGRTADLDGDGLEDAIATDFNANDVFWVRFSEMVDGQLTSSILDSGEDPLWGMLDWTESCPAGSDISVDLRVGYTAGTMGPWTNFDTPGTELPYYFDHHSFLQYRVNLIRGTASESPSLQDLTVTWNITGTSGRQLEAIPGWNLEPRANPSRGEALIMDLLAAQAGPVILRIHDLSGRIIAETEIQAVMGLQTVSFTDLPSGVFLCSMEASVYSSAVRVVVID